MLRGVSAALVFPLLIASSALAQNRPADRAAEKQTTTTTVTTEPAPARELSTALPPDALSEGSVTVEGKSIAYRAVAGILAVGATDAQDAMLGLDGKLLPGSGVELPPKPEDQPATARMFYTAYFAKNPGNKPRPVTFIYNGGPGSATMYLHMGCWGPKRIVTTDVQHDTAGPYKLVNNDNSLLDASDLVFIDAPGTGFSRVIGKDAPRAFYGIDEDGMAFTRFIARWLTKFDRWSSPKFLFGESYGTTRDAVLTWDLAKAGIDLNGTVFLSQILNFDNSADSSNSNPGVENGYFLALPSFAATAWYHKRVPNQPAALEPFLREVEHFATTDYAAALIQGADLDPAQKAAIAAKLESYTGIPAALWIKADLRMTGSTFREKLQESTGLTTGRLDSRYEGPAIDLLSEGADYDPFTQSITSAYLAAINTYAREDLHFGQNMTYKPSARFPGWEWNMNHHAPSPRGEGGRGPANVVLDLAAAMKNNPHFHVLLMGGYFDLGTLYYAAEFEMKHLSLPAELQKNIDYKFFETGHMVYVNEPAHKAMHDRTAEFIRANENGQLH